VNEIIYKERIEFMNELEELMYNALQYFLNSMDPNDLIKKFKLYIEYLTIQL